MGVSLLTRIVALGHPSEVIFDEVHYGKFANAYCCSRSRIFDVHPPHAKLLMGFFVRAFGYAGEETFDLIGSPLAGANVWILRALPATLGSLVPVLLAIFLLLLGLPVPAAMAAGFGAALDGALIAHSRILALDGPLLFFELATLVTLLLARRATGWGQLLLLALSGSCAGMAVGSKFVGAVVFLVAPWLARFGWRAWAVWASAGALVYLGGWYAHFLWLDQSGWGDAFFVPTGSFWPDLVKSHALMFSYGAQLSTFHADASAPWGWPLQFKAFSYWIKDSAAIWLFPNPIVWGLGTLGVVWALAQIKKRILSRPAAILLLAYACSWVPLLFLPRTLFLYHYLTAFLFSLGLFACACAHRQLDSRGFKWLVSFFAIVFAIQSPLVYGVSVGIPAQSLRIASYLLAVFLGAGIFKNAYQRYKEPLSP